MMSLTAMLSTTRKLRMISSWMTTAMTLTSTMSVLQTMWMLDEFNQLRMSRGFLPIVALDPQCSGSNQQPINNKGKGKKGRGKGRGGKNNVKYSKPPMKPHDPKGRAQAALRCLRCGSTSHTTAQCTQGSKPIQKATVEKAPCTDLRSDPTLLQNSIQNYAGGRVRQPRTPNTSAERKFPNLIKLKQYRVKRIVSPSTPTC